MKFLLIVITMIFASSVSFSQEWKRGLNWKGVFGELVSFNAGMPIIGAIDTNFKSEFSRGSNHISDTNGNYLLGSNSFYIYDKDGELIKNGDSLVDVNFISGYDPTPVTSQECIILPKKNNSYYIFNSCPSDSLYSNSCWDPGFSLSCVDSILPYNKIYMHVVDMDSNGGKGECVIKKRLLLESTDFLLSTGNMTTCRHANGKDWWLVKKTATDTIMYVKFLVTADSVYGPYFQGFACIEKIYTVGQTCFNELGTQMGMVNTFNQHLYLLDFDRSNGNFSNLQKIKLPITYEFFGTTFDSVDTDIFGLAFSPNGRFAYISRDFHIIQIDLLDNNENTRFYTISLDAPIGIFKGYYNLQLGPDCKIYISTNFWENWINISSISSPDFKGVSCNFCQQCLDFGIVGGAGVVPNMPNYRLGKLGEPLAPCSYPLSNADLTNPSKVGALQVYPNPANSNVIIDIGELTKNALFITNTAGQVLYNQMPKTTKTTIHVSQWASGVYFVRYGRVVKRLVVE